jgi:uncharacterized RDD family membrane protein YckC
VALVTCSECRAQVSDKAISCPNCGIVFNRCPECATEVSPGAATCGNCGYPFAPAVAVQAPSAASYSAPLLSNNTQSFGISSVVEPVVYAGFWRRFAAAIIDSIILVVILIIGDILLGVIFDSNSSTFAILSSGFSIGLGIAYFVGQESGRKQATIGKRAVGIIVTDLHGNRVSSMRATGRYFSKIVSGLILMIGYLMAGFTEKKQALHDIMAGTLVVVKPTSH